MPPKLPFLPYSVSEGRTADCGRTISRPSLRLASASPSHPDGNIPALLTQPLLGAWHEQQPKNATAPAVNGYCLERAQPSLCSGTTCWDERASSELPLLTKNVRHPVKSEFRVNMNNRCPGDTSLLSLPEHEK